MSERRGGRWALLAAAPLWGLLALLGMACLGAGFTEDTTPSTEGVIVIVTTPTPTPTPSPTPSPTPTPTPTPVNVCTPNPDPARPSLLQVLEPQPEEEVPNPFHLRGWGSSIGFEELGVALAVLDKDGEIVVEPLDIPPQPREGRIPPPGLEVTEFTRPFAADLLVPGLGGPTPLCVWVYLKTTPEGVPQDVVQVPVVVKP